MSLYAENLNQVMVLDYGITKKIIIVKTQTEGSNNFGWWNKPNNVFNYTVHFSYYE